MIVDITNEVMTKIESELKLIIPTINVLATYPSGVPKFPCVIIEEQSNTTHEETIDSNGQNHSDITIEMNIFSVAKNKTTEAKQIRNAIDSIMSDLYGMVRVFSGQTPNYLDENVYRYTLRYNGIVNENKTIFRR